jgi:hypothetical protein
MLLKETLGDLLNTEKTEEKRALIVGDFNAAPPGGRWGQAVREDGAMNE